jgi:hypothetical protein
MRRFVLVGCALLFVAAAPIRAAEDLTQQRIALLNELVDALGKKDEIRAKDLAEKLKENAKKQEKAQKALDDAEHGAQKALAASGLKIDLNGVGGETAKHEAVMKDMIKALDDLGDALATVKDKVTAKAAAVKINEICDRLSALGNKASALPKLSKAQNDALELKYKPQLEKVSKRLEPIAFQAGANSGGEPEFIKSLQRLQEVGTALQKLGGK